MGGGGGGGGAGLTLSAQSLLGDVWGRMKCNRH